MKKTNNKNNIHRYRKLPNLKALKTFEAVARNLSFTRAADELAVSQGAVSHQVKTLEEQLQVRLFLRHRNGINLTPEGMLLHNVCIKTFDEIALTIDLIQPDATPTTLLIQVGPIFAKKVIAPRIASFIKANPKIQLHLNNIDQRNIYDVLIDYCQKPPENKHCSELMQEKLVPVCSPLLIPKNADIHSLITNKEISHLHYRDFSDWQGWLAQHQYPMDDYFSHILLEDQHTILEAIKSGQGIGLIDRCLIKEDLKNNKVALITEQYFTPKESYKFIYHKDDHNRHHAIQAFQNWLISEIELL